MTHPVKTVITRIDMVMVWLLAEEKEEQIRFRRRFHIHIILSGSASGLVCVSGWAIVSTQMALAFAMIATCVQDALDWRGKW